MLEEAGGLNPSIWVYLDYLVFVLWYDGSVSAFEDGYSKFLDFQTFSFAKLFPIPYFFNFSHFLVAHLSFHMPSFPIPPIPQFPFPNFSHFPHYTA